tara:strand:- start:8 stop:2047 length:2040 start_codon:yes stop_codon:yes gene_type:complete
MQEITDPATIKKLNDKYSIFSNSSFTSEGIDKETLSRLNEMYPSGEDLTDYSVLKDMGAVRDIDTYADWITPSLELGATISASIYGSQKGLEAVMRTPLRNNPYAVGAATLGSGVIAGATAAFPAVYAGEGIEDLVEGRDFNPDKAFTAAVDAAQTEAIYGTGFGLLFPVAGKIAKYTADGTRKLAGKLNVPDPENIETIINLQKALKNYDFKGGPLTLLPTSVAKNSKIQSSLTNIAKVSNVTRDTVKNLLEGYPEFMGNQISKLISTFPAGDPTSQGKVLQSLISQTDNALSEIVAPIYKSIDAKGKGVIVDARTAALSYVNKVQKGVYRSEPTIDPKTGKETPRWKYDTAAEGEAIKVLEQIPSNLSFFEAHERLSKLKARIHSVTTSPSGGDNRGLLNVLGEHKQILEEAMDQAAEKLNPQLLKEYKNVTAYYAKGKKVVSSAYLEKALEVLDPVQVGGLFVGGNTGKEGLTVGVTEIKELMKLAREYKTQLAKTQLSKNSKLKLSDLDLDPIEGIRKGFLQALLQKGGSDSISSLSSLKNNLRDPFFIQTYNELFKGTGYHKKIIQLIDEVEILQRVEKASGGGLSLAIPSREISAVGSAVKGSLTSLVINLLPSMLAKEAISPKKIDSLISSVKAASEASKRNSPTNRIEDTIKRIMVGQRVGLGLGVFNQEN